MNPLNLSSPRAPTALGAQHRIQFTCVAYLKTQPKLHFMHRATPLFPPVQGGVGL